jgi:hypothetical protein
VLYDLSSSYFEDKTCPLAALGKNRDGKNGKLQVNYGLLTDQRGCPVAVSVHKGITNDAKTFLPQVSKLREKFGLEQMVIVGDRGMISQASIAQLREEQFSWITALKSAQIHILAEDGELQLGLFDERSLFELTHPDFPGERLIACRNPELAKLRQTRVVDRGHQGRARESARHGRAFKAHRRRGDRVGRVLHKYKVGKHFELNITDQSFDFSLREGKNRRRRRARRRLCHPHRRFQRKMSADDTARNYKSLIESIDLKVRPIHRRRENRVWSYVFLRMLAYYVEWHMHEAWAELFCRRGSSRQGHARSGRPRATLGGGADEGENAPARRRHTGAQLPHAARGAADDRAQHLPRAEQCGDGPDVRDGDDAERSPATRPRADRPDRPVDRNPQQKMKWQFVRTGLAEFCLASEGTSV